MEKRFWQDFETKAGAVPSSSHKTPDLVEYEQRPIAHNNNSVKYIEDEDAKHSEHLYYTHPPRAKRDAMLVHHHCTVKLSKEIFQGKLAPKSMVKKWAVDNSKPICQVF
jgi:hypothetical protein